MDQFSGATKDPIALLEQLIGLVGGLRRDFTAMQEDLTALKQDLAGTRIELKQEIDNLRKTMDRRFDQLESNFFQHVKSNDEDNAAFRTQVENSMERKTWLTEQRVRKEWQDKHDQLEQRIAELEEAERKRKEGKGA